MIPGGERIIRAVWKGMIKRSDYNANPAGTYYASIIDIDMEGKKVLSDILQPCTINNDPDYGWGGYYYVEFADGRKLHCWKSSLFLTMEEAVEHHNKEIKRALRGLDKFTDDLKRRLV